MKAQDLRLGNFVIAKNEIIKIIEFRESFVLGENNNSIIKCLPSQLKPIELTEEVLFKIGFNNTFQSVITKGRFELNAVVGDNEFINIVYHIYKSGKSDFNITQRHCESVCDNYIHKHNIKYLHQLQNIYYLLTDEELKINL